MLCRAPKAYPFPTGKASAEFQASPGSFDSFFGPEQSHSLRHTPLKWGWQDENLILGELGLGRTRVR